MDASHDWGGDLSLSPTGDLALAAVPQLTQQRVLRRLLTNAGDYIWHTNYGAGLGQMCGQPVNGLRIRGIIRSQIFAEAAVAATPEPAVDVSADVTGGVFVQLRYTDADTGQGSVLSFTLDY